MKETSKNTKKRRNRRFFCKRRALAEKPNGKEIPRVFSVEGHKDGVYRFGGEDGIAILKEGDTVRIYDYATGNISVPLTAAELTAALQKHRRAVAAATATEKKPAGPSEKESRAEPAQPRRTDAGKAKETAGKRYALSDSSESSSNTSKQAEASAKNKRITVGMSDAERAEILRSKKITPPTIKKPIDTDLDWEALEKNKKSVIGKPLLKKMRDLGFLRTYKTEAIDVTFDFTGGGLRKSMNSQVQDYGGTLADLAKVVMNMQALLDSSVLIEMHEDKAKGTPKANAQLVQTYVLMSAYTEDNNVVPVQFEVKQYVDDQNRLYLAVALTKIEADVMGDTITENRSSTRLLSTSTYSIPQLVKKINASDENFFKYIPDEFLNTEQKASKERAFAREAKKYGKERRHALSEDTDSREGGQSENRSAERSATREETDAFAKENVKEYEELLPKERSEIRALIRQARAYNYSDAEITTLARVSARSHVRIIFSKERALLGKDAEGRLKYTDGYYDPEANEIVINPEGKRSTERVLMHELCHVLYRNEKFFEAIVKAMIKGWDEDRETKRAARYSAIGASDGVIAEELGVHHAEDLLGNKGTLKRLLRDEPTLGDKILSFLGLAKTEYRGNVRLSRAAGRLYRHFEAAMDTLSVINQGNLTADTVTRTDSENTQVSEDGKRYAIKYPAYSDEDITENMKILAQMKSVATIDASKLEKSGKTPKEMFSEYFTSLGGSLYSEEFGDISLGNSSVKSEIRHGLTAEKIASMEAIPKVIEQGRVIFDRKRPGSDVNRIVVAAPIKIGNTEYYMGVMLQRDAVHQRLYLHNVAAIKTEEANIPSQDNSLTNWSDEENSLLLITSILQNAIDVKLQVKKISSTRRYALPDTAPDTTDAAENTVTRTDSENVQVSGDERRVAVSEVDTKADYVYTKAQYERFGWAREVGGITKNEMDDLESKIKIKRSTNDFKHSEQGEFIVEVNDDPKARLKVNNVFVFLEGTKSRNTITRVIRFDADTEMEMEDLTREIIRNRAFDDTSFRFFAEFGFATEYTRQDAPSFDEYRGRQGKVQEDGSRFQVDSPDRVGDQRRGDAEDFGEDGSRTVSNRRYALPESAPDTTTVGKQRQRYKASKADAFFTAKDRIYIETVDELYGAVKYLRKHGGASKAEAEAKLQAARSARNQAQAMIGTVQYNVFSEKPTYMGEGLLEIYKPTRFWSEAKHLAFEEYLLHWLNVDRMTLESRSREWAAPLTAELTAIEGEIATLTESIKETKKAIRLKETAINNAKVRRGTVKTAAAKGRWQARLETLTGELSALESQAKQYEKDLRQKKRSRKAKKAELAPLLLKNKPVFGKSDTRDHDVTAEESRVIVKAHEKKYPEFASLAKKIYGYLDNLQEMRIAAGLTTRERVDYMKKLYPHYVPSYRDVQGGGASPVRGKNVMAVSTTLRRAKGGGQDILRIADSIAAQTDELMRAGHINLLASDIYDAAKASGDTAYVEILSDESVEGESDEADMSEEWRGKGAELSNFIEEVNRMVDKTKRSKRKKKIGVITKQHADLINSLMRSIDPEFSAEGYELWIDGTGAHHIERRHGKNGVADKSMASAEAKSRILWAAQNADTGEFLLNDGKIKRSDRFFNRDGTRAPEVKLEKHTHDGTIYVSECVPDSNNRIIWITSAYANQKGSKGQLLNMEDNSSPQLTPEASFDSNATTNSIPDSDAKINPSDEISSEADASTESLLRPKEGQITFYREGKPVTMRVSKELLMAFDGLRNQSAEFSNPLAKASAKVNTLFKKGVTSLNPGFMLRNPIRDAQDAGRSYEYPERKKTSPQGACPFCLDHPIG